MDPPHPGDVGHDLRNLLGLIRALVTELGATLEGGSAEMREIARDLDVQSRFAIDALRVIEKASDGSPVEISLGAWAWSLRLWRRHLDLSDLTQSPSVRVVVPDALTSGIALVDALSSNGRLSVEADAGCLVFRTMSGIDARALVDAIRAVRALGLRVEESSGAGTIVRVAPI